MLEVEPVACQWDHLQLVANWVELVKASLLWLKAANLGYYLPDFKPIFIALILCQRY